MRHIIAGLGVLALFLSASFSNAATFRWGNITTKMAPPKSTPVAVVSPAAASLTFVDLQKTHFPPYAKLLFACAELFSKCDKILNPMIFRSKVLRSDLIISYIKEPLLRPALKQYAKDPVMLVNTLYYNISTQTAEKLAASMLVETVEHMKNKASFEEAAKGMQQDLTTTQKDGGSSVLSDVLDLLEKKIAGMNPPITGGGSGGKGGSVSTSAKKDSTSSESPPDLESCLAIGSTSGGGTYSPIVPGQGGGDPSPISTTTGPDTPGPPVDTLTGKKDFTKLGKSNTYGGVLGNDLCDAVDWNKMLKTGSASDAPSGSTKHNDSYQGGGTINSGGKDYLVLIKYNVVTYTEKGKQGQQYIGQTIYVYDKDTGKTIHYEDTGKQKSPIKIDTTQRSLQITFFVTITDDQGNKTTKMYEGTVHKTGPDVGATDIKSPVTANMADISPLDDKDIENAYLDCKAKNANSTLSCILAATGVSGQDPNDGCVKDGIVKMVDPNASPSGTCKKTTSAIGLDITKFYGTGTGLGVIDPNPIDSKTKQTTIINRAGQTNRKP